MRDYYQLLELPSSASADEIKSGYRRLAMKWHPDRNAGSAEAEERFKAISEAYATLSDPAKKANYDEYLAAGGPERAEARRGASDAQAGAYAQGGRQGARGFGGFEFEFRAAPRWDFSGFSAEEAADLFTREMYALAIELTMQNVGWRDIASELERRGCPKAAAADIARKIERRRKEVIRGTARPYFVRSALSGLAGLFLTAAFGGMGLGLMGLLGLGMFLNGGYNLVRALYFMTTGAAPRTLI
ncbi:MAG TPA: DnaJ domain-containing protein [Spirochaetales bacterium]|nr:DnaJ domain-containing protein [Spirochaetales bacterium]